MNWLLQDLRFALRTLRKERSFTLLATVALALGIGATTAIFSVIYNVLLNPFPYADSERLVMMQIHDSAQAGRGGRGGFSIPEFLDYQAQNHCFDRVLGSLQLDVLSTSGEGTERFDGAAVTTNSFEVLGMPPLLGRGITPADGQAGAPPVFVMSYKMWLKYYNLDPKVLGRSMVLNGETRTVVGIMPPRFTLWGSDLWLPATLSRSDPANQGRYMILLGRLKPGISRRSAEADLQVIARGLAAVYPKDYPKQFRVQVQTLADSVVGGFRTILMTLLAAVGVLLLIACGNVANLLLARATAREREIAIRASLGASRWRLVRQFLVESGLLALAGGALGCLFAAGGLKLLVAAIPEQTIPDEAVISLNGTVLLFTLGVAALTALLAGLAPAVHALRSDLNEPLKSSGKGAGGGFRHGKLRSALVVAEVALSIVLLVIAGLFMRSFTALESVDLGFNPQNILVVRLPLPMPRYKTAAAKEHFFQPLLQRLSALPGVVAATETSTLPPYGGYPTEVEIPGKVHSDKWNAIFQLTSEGYFQTLGVRMLRGRGLSEAEVAGARKTAVVNQIFAKKYFGKEDPLGRTFKVVELQNGPDRLPDASFEIVGVVSDVKNHGLQDPAGPEVFLPYTVTGMAERGILVRTSREPLAMLNAVRKEVWAVDPNVALTMTDSVESYLKKFSYGAPRFGWILLSVFAGIGLALVTIGVYGVMAYTVSRQTHEIGIRLALGASQANVLRQVVVMGVRLLAIGTAIGLAAGVAVSKLLASQLWGVSATDPVTFGVVTGVIAVTGVAACLFPAARAARVDPLIALRYE